MLKHAIGGATALLLATTVLARAEVEARTIWSDWQEVYARFGGTLSAESEDYAGGTLTLEGVTVTVAADDETAGMEIGTVRMVEQTDGTVRIELPAEMTLSTTISEGGVEQAQDMTIAQDGLSIVASETDGERTYEIAARSVSVAMTQEMVVPQGEAPQPDSDMPPTDITLTLNDIASTYRSGMEGEADAFAQDATVASARLALDVRSETDPLILTHDMQALVLDVTGAYGPAPTGPVRSLSDAGITYDATLSHSGSTLALDGSGEDMTYSVDGTSTSGGMVVGLNEDRLSYAVISTGSDLSVESSNLPMPVSLSMAELGGTLALPSGGVGEEKPFGLSLALRELVVDDAVWAMFDPTGQLPRDPATFVAELDGTAQMDVDLFGDPEALAALEGPPGALKTLNLVELTLEAAGAALRGSGELAFPERTPVPQPVGTIQLAFDGGFALLDKLVVLGFLPADQAAFIKGMSGAVAETVGEDQLESTIEFTPGGGITANGLPLR